MFGCTLTPGCVVIAYKAGVSCFRCVACYDKRKKGLWKGLFFIIGMVRPERVAFCRLHLKIKIDA